MPPQWNSRRASLEVSHDQNIYMTIKVNTTPDEGAPPELRTGYHQLLSMMKYSNDMCFFLRVIPLTINRAIVESDKIPNRVSALMRHFTATSRIKEKTSSVRATERLGFDRDY